MGFVSPEHYLSNDANIALDERGNYQANYGVNVCFIRSLRINF
jgi:glutamate synthase (NADPH/NADH) small chain